MDFTNIIGMFESGPKYDALSSHQRNAYETYQNQDTQNTAEETTETEAGTYDFDGNGWDNKALKYAILDAQIDTESRWNANAERDEGEHGVSKGVAQFLPGTWDFAKSQGWIGQDADPYDTETSLVAQQKYMDYLHSKAGGKEGPERILRTLAAYNAGLGGLNKATQKAIDAGTPEEWQSYLPNVTQKYLRLIMEDTGNYLKEGTYTPKYNRDIQ